MPLATTVSTTTKEDVKIKPRIKTQLLAELKAYAALRTQLKGIEAEMDQKKAKIGRFREEVGVTSLGLEGFKITRVSPIRKKFFIDRLLAMGVSTEMWNECHDDVPGTPYEKVSCPGDRTSDAD